MKFRLFRLLNQDAAAGAAPAAPSPAPDAGLAAASPSSGAPSSPGQDFSSIPNPDIDPEGWSAAWDGMEDHQREAYDAWARSQQNPPSAEETGDDTVQDPDAPAAPAAAPVAEDAEITEQVFSSLPANVQKALRDAQDLGSRFAEKEQFLNSEEDFKAILSDPVIKTRLAEMQHGIQIPKWLEADMDASGLIDSFLKEHGEKLDSLDPGASKEALSSLVQSVTADVTRRLEIKNQIAQAQARVVQERTEFLSNSFANLATEFAQLKSNLPLDSDQHPINGFREALLSDLESGRVSFDYVKDNIKGMFMGFAGKSVGEIVQAAQAKVRTNFLPNLTQKMREAAVTAAGAPRPAPPPAANQHGVDPARYRSDADYQRATFQRAEELAERGDFKLFDFLTRIESGAV